MRSPSLREGGGGRAIRHELQLKPGLWTRQAQVCLPRPQGCSQLMGLGGLQTGQRGSWAAQGQRVQPRHHCPHHGWAQDHRRALRLPSRPDSPSSGSQHASSTPRPALSHCWTSAPQPASPTSPPRRPEGLPRQSHSGTFLPEGPSCSRFQIPRPGRPHLQTGLLSRLCNPFFLEPSVPAGPPGPPWTPGPASPLALVAPAGPS